MSQIFNVDRGQLFRRRPFTFLEVIKLAKDFADALRYLHTEIHQDAMIIHRDLKPENLGLSADGSLKLFDFGLCCCVRKRTEDTEVYQMTGNTGSLRYMAPEVVLGKPYTEKVDVFSFAIVIWAIARNEEPFAGFDVLAHRQRVAINGERPAMKNSWPLEFKNLLSDCWHNDSTRRPDFVQIYDRLLKIEEIRKLKTSKQASINSFFRNISISPFGSVKQN